MNLTNLQIENFMAIGEASLNLSDRGLVLIQGENTDDSSASSNGAGKSTLPDALCWCLFGTTARGESGDKIVNLTAKKNCKVQIELDDDGSRYRITRYRKHSSGHNMLTLHRYDDPTSTWTDLTKGTDKLTQEVVVDILGCTYEIFRAAIYCGQEEMPNLPGMTDKQLKMLVEEAAGVTVLEQAYKIANARHKANEAASAASLRKIAHAEDILRIAGEHMAQHKDDEERWSQERAAQVVELDKDHDHCAAAVKTAEKAYARFKPEETADALETVKASLAAVASEKHVEEDLQRDLLTAQKEAASKRTMLGVLAKALKDKKDELERLDHQVGCPCSTCSRPLAAEDIAPAKAVAAKALASARSEALALKAEFETASQRVTSAQSALDEHVASMTDLSSTLAEQARLQAILDNAGRAHAAVDSAKRLLEAKQEERARKMAEPNPHTAAVRRSEQQFDDAEKALAALKTQQEAHEADLAVSEQVLNVFAPAGVRARILDDVTPFLNERTASYLGILSDGNISAVWTTLVKNAKGELREKFSIQTTNSKGGDSFGLISGGEKRKVRIASALALQDLVGRRATKPISLWIGDEIDDALDTAGLERLTAVLEEKAKERGSVFVISHADLKDWISQVITVRKSGLKSTLLESVE